MERPLIVRDSPAHGRISEGWQLVTSLDQSWPVTPAQPAGDHVESTPAERLAAILATLRRRWRVALLVFAITVGTTLFMTMRGPAEYAASAQILLQPSDVISQVLSPGVVASPANAQRDIDTNTGLITATPVLEAVRRSLRLPLSNRELARKIDVSGQEASNLVSITAQDRSAPRAARIATAVAVEYDNYRRSAAREAIRQSVAAGTSRFIELERTGGSAAERRALRDRLVQLQTSAAIGIDSPQIIRRAATPRAPIAPSRLIPIASALLGLMLAIGAALARELIDKRLLQPEDVESAFGVPILLSLSSSRRRRRDRIGAADDFEAYANLAARLALDKARDRERVLMISSTGPGDVSGKVATGLASQLAALGLRVVLIGAALRRGRPESNGEVEPPYGLSAVLLGLASFEDELLLLRPAYAGAAIEDHGSAHECTPVANPGVLLARSELASAIGQARADADFVIVEGPPAEMSEAFPVAALSDGILLVAEVPATTRDHAAGARHTLGPPYDKVLGLVLCPAARRRAWLRRLWPSTRLATEPKATIVSTAAAGDPARRRPDGGSPAPARSAG